MYVYYVIVYMSLSLRCMYVCVYDFDTGPTLLAENSKITNCYNRTKRYVAFSNQRRQNTLSLVVASGTHTRTQRALTNLCI